MDAGALDSDLERLLDHSDWLRALARKLVGDAATADDLVQETWLAAMKSPPDPDRPVRPWLAGVVRRLARMRARGEGRRARRQTEAAREDSLPSTAELVENVDTQRRLASVVTELSEPYRTTVMLRYFEGLSSADIARRQGVPSGTVRWRLKRGLDELRERLDTNYGSRQAWCVAFLALDKTQLALTGAVGATSGAAATTVSVGTLAAWAAVAVGALLLGTPLFLQLRNAQAAAPMEALTLEESLQPAQENLGATLENVVRTAYAGPRVRLVEEDGSSTAGVPAVLVLAGGEAVEATADDEGLLSFPTDAREGTLFVARDSSFLHVREATFDDSELELRLPLGGTLVGHLVDPDGAPLAGLSLKLTSDRQVFDQPVPEAVRRALGTPDTIRALTGPEGDFRFRGLPADWSGQLAMPASVVLPGFSRRDEAGRALHVEGARTDLVVEAVPLPRVVGLVVDPDEGPVVDAPVRIWADSDGAPEHGSTDAEGRFAVQLEDATLEGLRVEVEAPGGGRLTSLVFGQEDLPSDLDLGTIELLRGRPLELVVTDAEGLPLARAVARQVGAEAASAPTDGEGRTHIELLEAGEPVLVVDAPGYLSVRHEVGANQVQVALERAATLVLQARNAEGDPLPHLRVELQAPERLFAEGEPFLPSRLDLYNMVGRPGEALVEDAFGRFILSDDGLLGLPGVASAQPLTVRLYDPAGQLVASEEVSPLEATERREVEVVVLDPLRSLNTLVVDAAGEALVGAEVVLSLQGKGEPQRTLTGDEGLAIFEQLRADRVRLEVRMRGFVTQVHKDYVLPPPGQAAEFRLEVGHDLEVLVQDELGRQVTGGVLVSGASGEVRVQGQPKYAAEQELEDLSGQETLLTLYLGGLAFEQQVEPVNGRAVFTVPVMGRLQAGWTLPEVEGGEAAYRIVVQPADDQGRALKRRGGEGDGRNRLVHEIEGITSVDASTELVLAPGQWVVTLESSITKPAKGKWTAVGEPQLVTIDLEAPRQVRLGASE